MKYEHFGNLLQELRVKYNMSREKLAQNICTPKQIYRIEKGYSEPSIYLLHQLSIKFNLDLNEYYKMHFTSNTIVGLEGIKSINAAIEHNDTPLIKSEVEKYEKLEDFKHGENLQHIYYGKALCSALLDEDYNTSSDFCYKALQIECPDFNIDTISENMYSNIGICILNCISQNFFALDQYDNGLKVLTGVLKMLETFIIDSPYPLFQATQFAQKMYQLILYSMAIHLFEHGEIEDSLTYTEKGISYSLKVYNMRRLPGLIFMKFKILYSLKDYDHAKEYYDHTLSLYKITDNKIAITNLENSAKGDYPEIFKV
ncbi:helix-turn-helix transcriptional regulator [Anaerocolumna sp. AGMB13025]|uniref:helix-turn-helix transcriptional regulator n=1 Tax=Anaerocolumna sp. AGMB13025 TaxID=3039116 RepID=UPI00241E34D9|nr:helix-turn-helix transcriptional regulator [Anaerocolumna sp. AGMB13025]WFR57036.1 helix-turn-helix transcriptional regulator [Anaerocolumna sp. AGMB13025]